jgi:hypothetical protein
MTLPHVVCRHMARLLQVSTAGSRPVTQREHAPGNRRGGTVAGTCSNSTMGEVGPLSNGQGSKLTGRSLASPGRARTSRTPDGSRRGPGRSSLDATNPRNLAAPRVIATEVHRLSATFLRYFDGIPFAIEIKTTLVPTWLRSPRPSRPGRYPRLGPARAGPPGTRGTG